MPKTFKPSSHDMRPGAAPQAAEAATGIGEDYSRSPRPHYLERISALGFYRGWLFFMTLLGALVAAGYLWASYGPR